MSRPTAIIYAVVICLLVSMTWAVNHYRDNAITYKDQRDKATGTIAGMEARQRDIAALDAKYTGELADAKAENDALQRKLDHGGRVLVKGNCPTMPKPSATSGMDDGGTVELSATAGRNVLDSREGIKRDQAALRGLQQYIREQCFK